MLDRVARLTRAPCLLAWGTRLGGIAFYHVNGSCRAISANRGEINRENMAARGEFFSSYHFPMISGQRAEIQSIWRDQCHRRVSGREQARVRAGIWKKMEKSFLGRPFCLLCLAGAQKIAHAAHSLSRLGELHVKAGYVSTLVAG